MNTVIIRKSQRTVPIIDNNDGTFFIKHQTPRTLTYFPDTNNCELAQHVSGPFSFTDTRFDKGN